MACVAACGRGTDPLQDVSQNDLPLGPPYERYRLEIEERGREKPQNFLLPSSPCPRATNLSQFVQDSAGFSAENPRSRAPRQSGRHGRVAPPISACCGFFFRDWVTSAAPAPAGRLLPPLSQSWCLLPCALQQTALPGSLQLPATATVRVAASSFPVSWLFPHLAHQFLLLIPTAGDT